jgi:hypothetical protein
MITTVQMSFCNVRTYSLGYPDSLSGWGVLQNNREFVSAIPTNDIGRPQ